MNIKSLHSVELSSATNGKIESIIDDKKGVYVFCEGSDYFGDLSAANFACIELGLYFNKNQDLIESYNHTRDIGILEQLEKSISKKIEEINFQTYRNAIFNTKKNNNYPCASIVIVLVLNGYTLVFHAGSSAVYQCNSSGFNALAKPQTKFNDRIELYGKEGDANKIEEQAMLTNCIGRAPNVKIEPVKIQIANEIFVIALSSAANILHYDPSFLKELNAKKKLPPEELLKWIQNTYASKNLKRFDYVIIQVTTSNAEIQERRMKEEIKLIATLPIFRAIASDLTALFMVQGIAEFVAFRKENKYLFRRTDSADKLFIVLSGTVEVHSKEKKKLTATNKKNSLLGEVSIFAQSDFYVSDCKIIEDGRAMVIRKDRLVTLIKSNSRFGVDFMLKVAEEIAKKEIQLLDQ